ncbi:DUF6268 family outer membrane beta-barrel protein [Hymenobacter weizhouensis]|uniref:DUF6268 family outer membrane beta-barrel protein n=1 Tax=Hymenobacter sp. YIM 151500-1 TaxID=2987689 RepID=UPI002226143F|nr:DUF6268 family outer membrane beta-barrel protein [Hymenobacter sp. YIM 151500-1]UYZ62679.1 DUF6268 family outer membrane beta-barrel protein [Hymenobacter sp. YIM 151500-1]
MNFVSALLSRRRGTMAASVALLTTVAAHGQDLPARTPVYPPAAPLPSDTTATGQLASATKEFANPSVVGMGPSKGLIFHYERTGPFRVKSATQGDRPVFPSDSRNYQGRVSDNDRWVIKAYAPLWNRPHLKMVLGINYEREEFEFQNPPTNYSLYNELENRGLKTLGSQLVVLRPIDETRWILGRVKGELNGDYSSNELDLNDYLRMSYEFIYGWKRSPMFSWGVGVQIGYTFGRRSIYPAIVYNRTFDNRWGVESIFPARVTVRYNASPRSLLFAGYQVDGLSYQIRLRQSLAGSPDLRSVELRETEVKFRGRWEREIYDFLWFGLEGGYRYNHAFDAFDRRNGRSKVVDSKLAGAPYASLELFLVPPRRFLKKTAGQ